MKRLFTLFFGFMSLFLLVSCDSPKERPLTIGICPWPGYEPIELASRMGFFKDPVKIIRFSSPHEAYKAFKNGATDLVALTTDELLKLSDTGIAPKLFLITDISLGADALVVHPNIKSIDDLRGKTIALESGILSQYMLQRILDHSTNLHRHDITTKNIEIVKQKDAYLSGLADAFITFEPARGSLIKAGAKVLFDSSQIPNEIFDGIAAQNEVYRSRKCALKMFVEGWYKALAYIEKDKEEAYTQMGFFEHISGKDFKASIRGLKYGDEALNEQLITNQEILSHITKLKTMMTEGSFIQDKDMNIKALIGKL